MIKENITEKQQFFSVWDALEDTPSSAESMKLRSALMNTLCEYIQRHKMNTASAAKLLGVTQPRILDLMHGKIYLFELDALIDMACIAGFQVDLRLQEPA